MWHELRREQARGELRNAVRWPRAQADEFVEGIVRHSDAGRQYTAIRYNHRLADVGAVASIGSVGDSYDNAMAESVIGLYKTECVRREDPGAASMTSSSPP